MQYPTLRLLPNRAALEVLDQRRLPFAVEYLELRTMHDAVAAIRDMAVRGAPLIGLVGAAGVWLTVEGCVHGNRGIEELREAAAGICAARPTAVNLAWAVERMMRVVEEQGLDEGGARRAREEVERMIREDAATCAAIGLHGLPLVEAVAARKGRVNVLTHCNAGRLACAAWGTATSPIYHAHRAGIPLHVWVDETRPRNQGARLTAWELAEAGVPCTLIADNAGGYLMQRGAVDLVLVGCDRLTRRGDAANKIGTYLKALAARDTGVPFYVALPSSTIDWRLDDGGAIPIEERDPDEVLRIEGVGRDGALHDVLLAPPGISACNPGFDVTPARLIDGIITERGISPATAEGLRWMFPDLAA